jgi:hypothetical protein
LSGVVLGNPYGHALTGDGNADMTLNLPAGPSPRVTSLSWNVPGHRGHAHDEQTPRNGESDAQNARIARTVAEHATDADDCRLLLDMLGLRLDGLRAYKPPTV